MPFVKQKILNSMKCHLLIVDSNACANDTMFRMDFTEPVHSRVFCSFSSNKSSTICWICYIFSSVCFWLLYQLLGVLRCADLCLGPHLDCSKFYVNNINFYYCVLYCLSDPVLFSFILLCTMYVFCFHMKLKIFLSISMKNCIVSFMELQWICRLLLIDDHFIMLILPINKHGKSSHFLISSSISF